MTPEQLEREAADRIRRMGYPDELSDAERWHWFREDAELVAAANDVLWERVRVLEAAIHAACRELGIPGVGYPQPVANAFDILRDAVTRHGPPEESLAGGSDG